jgi:predicted ATP-grasp superfamily ATP-dependent carboligase
MHTVLILDGNQRSALAVTRSLGRRGVPVLVADTTARTLGGMSRYARGSVLYPSPYRYPERFIDVLKSEIVSHGVHVVFPMTDVTTHLVLQHREDLPSVSIPTATLEAFETLTDKWALHQLASQLAVPTPRTDRISSPEELDHMRGRLQFPLVVKSCRSRFVSQGKWSSSSVRYASSLDELLRIIETDTVLPHHPLLLQERTEGETHGVFALYDHGRPLAFFGHKRLREKPPSGGVSVLSESVAVDPCLRELTHRVLGHVLWHGVAMAEFKVCPDGRPFLIEINARFWGSLQLAIDAGLDFPWLLYQIATGGDVAPTNSYRVGVRSRWLLGDLDHLYLVLKARSERPDTIRALAQFFCPSTKPTRFETNRWNDLRPFLLELFRYLRRPKDETS